MNILFIDNFDSFTYNLVDEFKRLGCDVKIYRNDITLNELDTILRSYDPKLIVISPGPSTPKDAGICIDLIKRCHKDYPMLGICLGHQCIVEAFGGTVSRANMPVHGKKSMINHDGSEIFNGIPKKFTAGRYHSLFGSFVPSSLKVTSKVDDIPMSVEHVKDKVYGLQFHPESILTTHGSIIIKNILEVVR